jgi:hypothetical protein
VPTKVLADALDGWREGERVLELLAPQTPEHETVAVAVHKLRDTYQRLTTSTTVSSATLEANRHAVAAARGVIADMRRRTEGARGPTRRD